MCRVWRSLGVYSVVSGGVRWADSLAARFALSFGLSLRVFGRDYELFGRRAPLLCNWDIVLSISRVVAFLNGASRGCAHAISIAKKLGVPCVVVRV